MKYYIKSARQSPVSDHKIGYWERGSTTWTNSCCVASNCCIKRRRKDSHFIGHNCHLYKQRVYHYYECLLQRYSSVYLVSFLVNTTNSLSYLKDWCNEMKASTCGWQKSTLLRPEGIFREYLRRFLRIRRHKRQVNHSQTGENFWNDNLKLNRQSEHNRHLLYFLMKRKAFRFGGYFKLSK